MLFADGKPVGFVASSDVEIKTKESTKEKTELVKFSLIWDGQYDPDIAFVYNIYNYAQLVLLT